MCLFHWHLYCHPFTREEDLYDMEASLRFSALYGSHLEWFEQGVLFVSLFSNKSYASEKKQKLYLKNTTKMCYWKNWKNTIRNGTQSWVSNLFHFYMIMHPAQMSTIVTILLQKEKVTVLPHPRVQARGRLGEIIIPVGSESPWETQRVIKTLPYIFCNFFWKSVLVTQRAVERSFYRQSAMGKKNLPE